MRWVCVGCALGVRWVCLGQGVKDGQRLWLWVDLLWRSIPFEQAREPTTTRKTAASACAHCLRRLVAHAVCCFMPLPIRAHLFCKATGKLLAHMIDQGYDRSSCGSESSGFQHLGYLDVQRSADECSTESANTKMKLLHS